MENKMFYTKVNTDYSITFPKQLRAKLNEMSWDKHGIKASITSDRNQTLTIRNRRKNAEFYVNGKVQNPEGNYILVELTKGEEICVEVKF